MSVVRKQRSASRSWSYSYVSSTSRTASRRPDSSASATRSPFGASGTARQTGSAQGSPFGEAHVLDDALVVVATHEALERRQSADGEHVQVGDLARGQSHGLERIHAVGPFAEPVDELSPMRLDQALGRYGNGGHAATCAGIRPSSSSFAITTSADSSGVLPSVSTTISGLSGASYGSSTPVKPLISPANAFA